MNAKYRLLPHLPRWSPVALGVLLAAVAVGTVPGSVGDSTADLVLGQHDFVHNAVNFADAKGLFQPQGTAVDSSVSPHRVYVVDRLNNRVLRFPNAAAFLNGEPADLVLGQPDFFSVLTNQGGAVGAATLSNPAGVAVDSIGNVFVADANNNRVVEYLAPLVSGKATGVALGQPNLTSAKCGVTSATTLSDPQYVALDPAGDVLVSDFNNSRVLLYPHGSIKTGAAATQAVGQPNLISGGCNGPGQNVLCNPEGIAVDPKSGKLWVADLQNNRVVRFGLILTNAAADLVLGQLDFTHGSCNQGQSAPQAQTLCSPDGVAVDPAGNVYVTDFFNNRVVEYNTPAINDPNLNLVFGQTATTTNACNQFGIGANSLCSPSGVALDGSNLFVSDQANNRLLEFDAPLINGTTAMRVLGQINFTNQAANFVDALGMNFPQSVAIDRSVTPNRLYVADIGNNRILGYSSVAALVSGASASLVIGQPDFFSSGCNGGTFSNVDADSLCGPQQVAVDGVGNLYVADGGNNRVLEYDSPFTKDGFADRVYGQAGSFLTNQCNLGNPGAPTASSLCVPLGVAIDPKGNLYIADSENNRVVEYTSPLTNNTGNLIFGQFGNPTAGQCNAGLTGPTPDTLCFPEGLRTDAAGNLYIADNSNSRVLEYNTPLSSPNEAPTADLVFGQGGSMFSGLSNYGGISFDSLSRPVDVAIDSAGNVYIGDQGNARVLEYNRPLISHATSANRIFGQPTFFAASCNRGGLNANSQCFTGGVALDSNANLYVVDAGNNRVLVYDQPVPVPTPTVLAPAATRVPTHTPTRTPARTSTPVATRTPSRTPTAKPTPTRTATPVPRPIAVRITTMLRK
jgi:sugar lactone lactonase YvrE